MALKQLGITTIGSKVVKISVYLGVGAALVICTALAGQIDIPHQFTSGTPARAAEVNANFAALAEESNAQDTRLTAIENSSSRVSAQMICQNGFGIGNMTFQCVRDSNPVATETLTYADIVARPSSARELGSGTGATVKTAVTEPTLSATSPATRRAFCLRAMTAAVSVGGGTTFVMILNHYETT